ncbi:MAG: response regulator transcription factor [Actinomycetales bacterium]|jgi:DNA-binding NarL/FixJ family response regulator|uniref:Response regulator transcription factor n=1 Tax=Candidatus Phosphoribacter hodrii TaxID=2953743 RepID=A0A935IXP7_9MICO|nr:response regulator transcription factor [Candidatus Phosphoribacter hodrii]MBP8838190.1 response regulator transcription factor [Dermatophilaceae bacterium]MBK7274297.1 response regulator transcription factor [Candidatus Phosphoribacter hodrii]MBL0003789.1 response regulator transcription factor [Candidatus Phosphoribacter hodrii]HNV14154.1 response regulator transcription factor [Dermatophilaceae bacterium]
MTVRVVVIDDQTLVRQGIVGLLRLSGEVEVIGQASDGAEGLEVVAALRPDVVLLDLRMPILDGLGVLQALAAAGDRTPVLVLTTFPDDEALIAAMRAGARGYLLKDVSLDQLVDAITTLAGGGTIIQPSVTEALVRQLAGTSADVDPVGLAPEPLTARETEVLRLLSGGYSNREIAAAMFLAEGTIKNHVSAVLLKLGVRDRTRAVLRGLELGLIQR